MRLTWERARYGEAEFADGQAWRYLIAGKPGAVVLTRYPKDTYSGPGRYGREADCALAAQHAAVHAIKAHPRQLPAPAGADLANARKMAQDFEDGDSLFGIPSWQHERRG